MIQKVVFVLLLWCFSISYGRVSVGPDGSITLASSQIGGTVEVQGDFVVSGRSLAQEMTNVQSAIINANQLALYNLQALRYQAFPFGTTSSTFFSVGTNSYLITLNPPSLYTWNTVTALFGNPTPISFINPVNAITIFNYGSSVLMIDANTAMSSLSSWNPTTSHFTTNISSVGLSGETYGWSFLNLGTTQFLAQATGANIGKIIYQFTGQMLTPAVATGPPNAPSCRDWNFFSIGSTWYAVLSCLGSGSYLMTYSGTSWTLSATIPTTDAYNSATFQSGGNTYLVFSDNAAGNTSEVYMWNGMQFSLQTTMQTGQARNVRVFTLGNTTYCLVSNINDASMNTLPSQLFKWNKYLVRFDLIASMDAANTLNYNTNFFTVGLTNYLFAASSGSGTSYLYKMGIV